MTNGQVHFRWVKLPRTGQIRRLLIGHVPRTIAVLLRARGKPIGSTQAQVLEARYDAASPHYIYILWGHGESMK